MQRLCVIGCQITRTWIHTLLKRLASARHDNREKTVLLPDCTLQTKPSMKTKEVDDVFSRRPLYCGRARSDVIGCRRPTGGVFICMLHTRVTLTAFPIATPRGCSSKFPWRGTVFYHKITWNVHYRFSPYIVRKHTVNQLTGFYCIIFTVFYS